MFQDIHPHRFDIGFRRASPEDGDRVVLLRDGRILLSTDEDNVLPPRYAEVKTLAGHSDGNGPFYLFSVGDTAFFHSAASPDAPRGFDYADIQSLRNRQPRWQAFAGATAWHLASWYGKNRFCGVCGAGMSRKEDERALRCPSCGEVVYPRISPAVIVAVTDGDKLLLTRYANRPNARRHALVAGFMEIGETLEDTVRREVMEETGVRVRNIRYYKSQPWAFSGSVLAGFFADLDGSPDIALDANELQEAAWVARPDIPPADTDVSLTSEMIELFRTNRCKGQ